MVAELYITPMTMAVVNVPAQKFRLVKTVKSTMGFGVRNSRIIKAMNPMIMTRMRRVISLLENQSSS